MKKTFFVFLSLTVLFVGLLTMRHFQKITFEKAQEKAVEVAKLSFDFDPMKITECIVSTQHERVELKKDNGIWRLMSHFDGIQADAMAFLDFLASLKKINTDERIVDESQIELFGLAEEDAIRITLYQEDILIEDLLLSMKATQQNSNFIRRKDTYKVYAVNEDVITYLGFGKHQENKKLHLDKWVDKRVLMFDERKVQALQIYDEGALVLDLIKLTDEDEKSFWKFQKQYSYEMDQEKVKNYFKTLTQMRGAGVENIEDLDIQDDQWSFTIFMPDDISFHLTRLISSQGDCYLKVNEHSFAFKISSYLAENLMKTDGAFFRDNPLNIAKDDVKEVKIKDYSNKKNYLLDQGKLEAKDKFLDRLKSIKMDISPETSSKFLPLFDITWTQGKDKRMLKIFDIANENQSQFCYKVQVDKLKDSLCVSGDFLQSLLGNLK